MTAFADVGEGAVVGGQKDAHVRAVAGEEEEQEEGKIKSGSAGAFS